MAIFVFYSPIVKRRVLRRKKGDYTLLPQPVEGEAMAAVNSGFFEDVLEVDFHCTGANAEFLGDFAVFEALLD